MHKIILFLFISLSLFSKEPITPIPLEVNLNKKKVILGKELFFDVRLSKDNTISCHSCHNLAKGGVDNQQFSFGIGGQIGKINTPTVFNSSFNFVQFWDGRAKTLHEQALGPIEDPAEMGISLDELLVKLNNTEYKDKFKKLYKQGLTKDSLVDAIAEYEKSLNTINAPFDKFLRGDENAITQNAKKGYKLFKEQGCIACHHGINVGGNLYAKFGAVKEAEVISKGRFEVTKNELDLYHFKVPSLRNIELTYPYLHDGRFDTLEDTVKFMAYHQLGKTLKDEDIENIVSFLKTLTGTLYEFDAK